MKIKLNKKHLPHNFTTKEQGELLEWLSIYEVDQLIVQESKTKSVFLDFFNALALVQIVRLFSELLKWLFRKKV